MGWGRVLCVVVNDFLGRYAFEYGGFGVLMGMGLRRCLTNWCEMGLNKLIGRVVESVDTSDLKSDARWSVRVQVPPRSLFFSFLFETLQSQLFLCVRNMYDRDCKTPPIYSQLPDIPQLTIHSPLLKELRNSQSLRHLGGNRGSGECIAALS